MFLPFSLHLHTFASSSQAASADLLNRWVRPGRRVVNTYGPTEATVIATHLDWPPPARASQARFVLGHTRQLHRNRNTKTYFDRGSF